MNHVPAIPTLPVFWSENWTRGANEPDRWTATKKYWSGVVVHEVEFSKASYYVGHKASATFSCTVEVAAPRGYVLVADCDRPLPSVWYPMRAEIRRFALYPKDRPDLRPEAERVARGFYDTAKWRRGRLAYGPCSMPLPDLTSAQASAAAFRVSGWLNTLRGMLSGTGVGPVEDAEDGLHVRRDGWAPWGRHPDGVSWPPRDAPAGSGVFFYTGWEQAPDSVPYSWLKAGCCHARNWVAYERGTGEPINVYHYGDPGPKYQAGTGDPNNGWLPEFVGVAPWPDPLPLPYDASHSLRGFRDLIFLSECMDSRAVRRMLKVAAAQFRLQFSDRGPLPTPNYTPPALRTWLGWAKNAPHNGFYGMDTGRMMGEPAMVIAQSIKRAGASENKPWASMFAEFVDTCVMPNGITSRCAEQNPTSVWYDPNHDTAHSFEVPLLRYGAVGCSLVSGRPLTNPTRYAECLYEEAPLFPYYGGLGPPQYAYVAARGGAPYTSVTSGKNAGQPNSGDSSHVHAGCALAASIEPNYRARWVNNGIRINPNLTDLRGAAGLIAQQQRI